MRNESVFTLSSITRAVWFLYVTVLTVGISAQSVKNGQVEEKVAASISRTVNSVGQVENIKVILSEGDSVKELVEKPFYDREYDCPGENNKPCLPKCCSLNQGFDKDWAYCSDIVQPLSPVYGDRPGYQESVAHLSLDDQFVVITGIPCKGKRYMLMPEKDTGDQFTLYSNGSILVNDNLLKMSHFCMESFENITRAFMCDEPEEELIKIASIYSNQYTLYATGLLISVPFLLATAFIYTFIPDLRDLKGKCLSCHVTCLALGYFFLALIQLANGTLNDQLCVVAAFTVQFFFTAAFFWLNVLSFDIWRNIKIDPRKLHRGFSDRKKFVLYSMYAWYGSSFLLIISLVMDLRQEDSLTKPHFGLQSCWFSSDASALPYFYAPLGVLVGLNLIFYILSVIRIYQDKEMVSTKLLQRTISQVETKNNMEFKTRINKKALKQCLLLFVVMGINWLAEILSWAVGGPIYIWVVTDLFNTLQGLLIFYIFVLRQEKVRNLVKDCSEAVYDSFRKKFKGHPDSPENSEHNNTRELEDLSYIA